MPRSSRPTPESIVLTWTIGIPILITTYLFVGLFALAVVLVCVLANLYFVGVGRLLKNSPALRDPLWGRVIATGASAVLVISVVLTIQLIVTR
ncbi:hypothetical protein [Nocardia brasiliensis]|uniref:hypothetical protein n=1 Tax=Nocardia brasiliensis TaxID=37326 RepID=UPI00366BE80F